MIDVPGGGKEKEEWSEWGHQKGRSGSSEQGRREGFALTRKGLSEGRKSIGGKANGRTKKGKIRETKHLISKVIVGTPSRRR